MITSILKGGLGNQMFQYAAGRSLALEKNVSLALETSHFGFEKSRIFDLGCFAIDISSISVSLPHRNKYQLSLAKSTHKAAAQPEILLAVKYSFINAIAPHQAINQFLPLHKKYYYLEKQYSFDESLFSLGSNVTLDGYWQCEKYFKNIAAIVRQDFQFSALPSHRNQQTIDEMSSSNSISVHVRRGDYVSNAGIKAIHGVCGLDYYQKAINLIRENVSAPHFYVFSDDITWCKENLAFSENPVTFVDRNQGHQSYEDMRLMSHCKHHIIANSSFSWWGAWLNPRADKIVIAPKQWFAKPNINTQDVVPAAWIRL